MSQTKTITLELDADDYDAVQKAISIRQGFGGGGLIPEGGGNLAGRLVAEICRGWEEMLDASLNG
jgi:hypothetical protein